MSTDTSLGPVETDTEGKVFLQPGTASHTIQRGAISSPGGAVTKIMKVQNPLGDGVGVVFGVFSCMIDSSHPSTACRESRILVILWIQGRGGMMHRAGKIIQPSIQALELGDKDRPHCCHYPVQYFWWISILCVGTSMLDALYVHYMSPPVWSTCIKRTNVNKQFRQFSQRDTVIIKRPIIKCRKMFDCWNDSCSLFIILNKRRWFQKIVFPWLFFPGDSL